MDLWKLKPRGEEGVLIPLSTKDKHAKKCIAVAADVPGAVVDSDGSVEGALHTLFACLEAAGQQVEWSKATRLKPMMDPKGLPPFQAEGVAFIRGMMDTGVLINDDVGIGKTVQTIAALAAMQECKVVLCPSFLKQQWQGEIHKWSPLFAGREQRVQVVWPSGDKRSKLAPIHNPDWVVAFYLDAEKAMEAVGSRSYVLVIDEIHNVRGFKTQRLEAVQTASTFAAGRMGLTGSVLYNDGARIHPILSLISPGYWGNFASFAKRYAGATEGEYGLVIGKKLTNAPELRKRMSTMSFRRTRPDVYKQLPFETVYQTVWLEMPGMNSLLLASLKSAGMEAIAAHAHLVAGFKVKALQEYIANDNASDQPSITFTWLREQAKSIAALLPDSYLVLGGDSSSLRLKRIADYVARCKSTGKVPHVIGTYGALSEGANLQWAKTVNLAALDYTPDVVKQAVGRAARMGQTGTVTVRLFLVRNSIDEHMGRIVQDKLAEQFKLDGRQEMDKAQLNEALELRGIQAALKRMYERALREEKRA
jgi:superfamily II DNA or RNA helicase